jgi:hypothetical protein
MRSGRFRLTSLALAATLTMLAGSLAGSPALAAGEPMLEFRVVKQDTLSGLSRTVLASPGAWREVARINKLRNPNLIRPGQVLRIPARLLRMRPVPAQLVSVTGDVQVGTRAAAPGMAIVEGEAVQTGENGSAVLELGDRSRVQVPPSSLAELAASRQVGARVAAPPNGASTSESAGWFTGSLRLLRGSVEVFATKVLRLKPLEVVTPTAVIGVRGTHYRVTFDEEANRSTHSEVVEGKVRFDRADRAIGTELTAGFGAQADSAASTRPVATKMLDAPDLSALPRHFERPLVRLAMPEANGPTRVQVAADPAFNATVSDQRAEAGAEVRIDGLADGNWNLRARRIGERGIEGRDAMIAFVLKARPEPPAYSAPRSDAKQPIGSIDFAWAQNVEAPRAHIQVAQDADFSSLVIDQDNVPDGRARAELAAPGTYYWRLASIRPDGDHGPYGDPQRFELRAMPTPPAGTVSSDGKSLVFKWSGRPGDRQLVELARDPQFSDIIARDQIDSAEWQPAVPASAGRYYFRYRSVESDGYVSPYSETLMLDVPRDGSLFLLLLPLLVFAL